MKNVAKALVVLGIAAFRWLLIGVYIWVDTSTGVGKVALYRRHV